MKKLTKGLLLTMSVLSLGAFVVGTNAEASYSMKQLNHRLNANELSPSSEEEVVAFSYTEIENFYKSTDSFLSVDEVTKKMDFVGYKSLEVFKDEYTGNGDVVGEYKVIYEVVPNGSDEATYITTTIEVQENLPLCNYYILNDELFVDTNLAELLDDEALTKVIMASGLITSTTATVTYTDEKAVLSSEEVDPGEYVVYAQVKSADGNSSELTINLNVVEEDSGVVIDTRKSVWEKIVDGVCDFFTTIWDGLVWIYDHTIGAIVDWFNSKD